MYFTCSVDFSEYTEKRTMSSSVAASSSEGLEKHDSASSNSGKSTNSSDQKSKKSYKEIYTLEFKQGDIPRRFVMSIPTDCKPGEIIENIGGHHMSIMVPDDLSPGEKVILVTSLPKSKLVSKTEEDKYLQCTDLPDFCTIS